LDSLSPGIEPRMPTVFGWSAGSHTSIVPHSSCDCNSLRSAGVVVTDFAEAAGHIVAACRSVATTVRETKSLVDLVTL
jgi:hypothetical protein